ncbi:MAG: ribose 5-phosphate isomerase B [Bacteroidales bacterium]|nr:ribose 5-phosphate isomerase B [Bacteroidales bacterium]MBQ9639905.1 ribose 5-phosphate isomerase B [Bacteroidales bacterium]
MKEIIAIACDHAGFGLKKEVVYHLKEHGFEVQDYGTDGEQSVDYPDYAHPLGKAIEGGEYKRGIVICGSGNGVQMTVNKYPHVRCALCWNEELAELARRHNDANVLSLPARFIDKELALMIVDRFLSTPFDGGRHQRRVEKISELLAR